MGGGSLAGEDLPTVCVRLRVLKNTEDTPSVEDIARLLRLHTPAVFARIKADALLFDPRALEPGELDIIASAARKLNETLILE